MTDDHASKPFLIPHDEFVKLPLRDQAHFWLYGRTPTGRTPMWNWTRPHEAVIAYVRELEARVAGAEAVDEHADDLRKLADT